MKKRRGWNFPCRALSVRLAAQFARDYPITPEEREKLLTLPLSLGDPEWWQRELKRRGQRRKRPKGGG